MSDNVTDTNRRFEITVPSPKARINMGAPKAEPDDTFGYTGLSLQSDVHLFIDANKHTLFQTGQNYCGQVGGKWLQYSNADMIMSATANVNLSADNKILIASGAGQGQVTALDHGSFVRVVPYNALKLHYEVDAIQSGLYEFFHGRRARRADKGPAGLFKELQRFDRTSADLKDGASFDGAEAKSKGFLEMARLSLQDLYVVEGPKKISESKPVNKTGADPDESDPVRLLLPLRAEKLAGKDDPAGLKWGFTPYFKRFDPYAKIDPDTVDGTFSTFLANFKNTLASMRRFADLAEKYAQALTDNWLMSKAQNLMSATDHLAKATWNAFHFAGTAAGIFLPNSLLSQPGMSGFAPKKNLMQDEFDSGMKARFATDGSRSITGAGDAAVGGLVTRQASVTTGAGTWDLSSRTSWPMTIEWDSGSTTINYTFTGGSPALLTFTAAVRWLRPTKVDVVIDSDLLPTGCNQSHLVTLLQNKFGAGGAVVKSTGNAVSSLTDLSGGVEVTLDFSSLDFTLLGALAGAHTIIADPTVLAPLSETVTVTLSGGGTLEKELRLGDISNLGSAAFAGTSPTIVDNTSTLAVTVEGSAASVALTSATIDWTQDDEAVERQGLFDQITGAVGSAATVNLTTTSIEIEGKLQGAASQIVVGATSAPAALSAFGLTSGQTVNGSSTTARDQVSARDIQELIGPQSGITVAPSGESLVFTSDTKGVGSKVKVSGPLAEEIFGTATKEDEVTADEGQSAKGAGPVRAAAQYKQLISWNHELQKLPEDTRNLTRPIRDAINDVVGTATEIEGALEDIASFAGTNSLPSPPKAIGLIANEGISLGTQDRIVGAGGKGVVFVVDGGTGNEDNEKFLYTEGFVNRVLTHNLTNWLADPDPRPTRSLGFRVLSESVVDLMGSTFAQLAALGRGTLSSKWPDDLDKTGVGVARVIGSHAAEIAGYRKVVISARSGGKAGDATGWTGGRVELAGQTIALGGVNLGAGDKDLKDFIDAKGFGIEPPALTALGGFEHLEDGVKDDAGVTNDLKTEAKDALKAFAWPKELRTKHPNTEHVVVHAAKDTVIVVGPYIVVVDKDAGVTVGQRVQDADPTKNVIDIKKPRVLVSDTEVKLRVGDSDTENQQSVTLVDKDKVVLYHSGTAQERGQLQLKGGKATLFGTDKSSVDVSSSGIKLKSPGIKANSDGNLELKGGVIKLG